MKRLVIISLIACAFSACSEQVKHYKAAKELGEKHAKELLNDDLTDNQLAVKLLDVRAKEQEIRTKINDTAADAYIESFTSFIKLNDDSLSSLIFIADSITLPDNK